MDILPKKNQTTQFGELGNRFVNPLLHTKFMSDYAKAHGLALYPTPNQFGTLVSFQVLL